MSRYINLLSKQNYLKAIKHTKINKIYPINKYFLNVFLEIKIMESFFRVT